MNLEHRSRKLSGHTLSTAPTAALLAHLQRLTAADFPKGHERRAREIRQVRAELTRRTRAYLAAWPRYSAPGSSPLDPESIRLAAALDTGPALYDPRTASSHSLPRGNSSRRTDPDP